MASETLRQRLWLGSIRDRLDGVRSINVCLQRVPRRRELHISLSLTGLREGSDSPKMRRQIRSMVSAVKTLDERLQRGQPTLIHCFAGISRAPAVVSTWIAWRRGWSLDRAYHDKDVPSVQNCSHDRGTPETAMTRLPESYPEAWSVQHLNPRLGN